MKKPNVLAAAAIAALLSSAAFVSLAGESGSYQVFINDASRFATGSMVTARYSGDSVQRIECRAFAHRAGMVNAYCFAKNAQGVTRTCFTTLPVLVENARAASSESMINFYWEENGDCESISIENASRWKR